MTHRGENTLVPEVDVRLVGVLVGVRRSSLLLLLLLSILTCGVVCGGVVDGVLVVVPDLWWCLWCDV